MVQVLHVLELLQCPYMCAKGRTSFGAVQKARFVRRATQSVWHVEQREPHVIDDRYLYRSIHVPSLYSLYTPSLFCRHCVDAAWQYDVWNKMGRCCCVFTTFGSGARSYPQLKKEEPCLFRNGRMISAHVFLIGRRPKGKRRRFSSSYSFWSPRSIIA